MRIIPSIEFIPGKSNVGSALSVIGPDFTFSRTTTPVAGVATRVNASGLIETVPDNVLRLDYPIGGGCPAALIEPSAQNIFQRSEEFNDAYWSLSRSNAFGSGSIVNAINSPDATATADYIQQQTGETVGGGVFRGITVTSGTVYTLSVFAKQGDNRFLRLGFAIGAAGAGIFCNFDLQDGLAGTPSAGITPTIANFGNGWFRCSITATSQVSASALQFIYQANALSGSTATPDTGIYIWGAQLETGAIPTSYIPTTTGQATRDADVCLVSGVSGYIGQTEGTIYVEVDLNQNSLTNVHPIVLWTAAPNRLQILIDANRRIIFQAVLNGIVGLQLNPSNVLGNGVHKIALGYQSGNSALYLNGVSISQSTTTYTVPPCSNINLGSNAGSSAQLNDRIRAAALYTTRLSNDQLASLTRLT